MIKVKPHLKDLFRTPWDNKSRRGNLCLDMNEGIPGLPDDFIGKALSKVDKELLSAYPEYIRLKEKIAAHNRIQAENICLANGSDGAIKYIFDAYVSSQERVLLTDPTFAMYPVYCSVFAAKPIIVGYKEDLSFPYKEFLSKITPEIRLAVVVNPNNPTGSVLSREKILNIVKRASDNGVLVVVDEAYYYFYNDTMIEEVRNYENLIVLRTFSKLCGMAGARIGYAAACSAITESLAKVKSTFDVNSLAVLLAEELLDRPKIIKELIGSANAGKKYLADKLKSEGLEYRDGRANFILIKCAPRVSEVMKGLNSEQILVNGEFKQSFLRDYIRVTIGSPQVMERFWDSFIKVWKAKNRRE